MAVALVISVFILVFCLALVAGGYGVVMGLKLVVNVLRKRRT